MSEQDLHVIIPAGGAGTRLWPLSRADRPKFLLDLTCSGRTLLQQTWDRLAPLAKTVTVVTGTHHATAVAQQLPGLPPDGLLVEPSPRDSMAAIGFAAALILRDDPDAVIGSFAADHVIRDGIAFAAAVMSAVSATEDGHICTIGIEPDSPSTAFGYIETGAALSGGGLAVHRFVEKPDAETAAAYVDTGRFHWNAGMFVARADVLLRHLARLQPSLHAGLTEIAAAWGTPAHLKTLAGVWPTLPRISIDHALAEPVATAGGVACIPAEFGWRDVGDFDALAALLPGHQVKVLGEEKHVRAIDSSGVVVTGDRFITLLGVHDVVVVDTGDTLLVTTRKCAQRVKEARDSWRTVRDDLL
jgi:mannose-1-phosphate guanylyltransferase